MRIVRNKIDFASQSHYLPVGNNTDWTQMIRHLSCVMAALVLALGAGLARPGHAAPLQIVATTGMVADAARQVGGDAVEVTALMGAGIDPHSYRQTRSDIVALTRADLVLWHGLYLEAQLEELMLRLSKTKTVVPVAEALPRDILRAHPDYEGRVDPHVWMVPEMWALVVDRVADVLTEARPEDAAQFRANAAAHKDQIAQLQAYAETVMPSVPAASRVLLTAHDAFGYFGRAFRFDVVGVQGISTESEAGLSRIRDLVDLLVARDVRAVFVESSVSDRNLRAVIEGAATRGQQVTIGGELFSDAMGAPGTYEGTYIGMLDHNITTIARALGGQAPAGGLNGKLAMTEDGA